MRKVNTTTTTPKTLPKKKGGVSKVSDKKAIPKTVSIKNVSNAKSSLIGAKQTDNFIDISLANAMIATAIDADKRPAMDYPRGIIEELLSDESVAGIRIYNAIDSNNNKTYVLKGYDENNYDVLLNRDGVLGAADMGQPCNPDTNVYQKSSE